MAPQAVFFLSSTISEFSSRSLPYPLASLAGGPTIEATAESLSTIKFAERVSGVELGAAKSSKAGRDVRELMEQVLFIFFRPI
ncbi:hypothetical protein ACH5RR_023593 [Cinchona calisaya]|uniref:Kinesin motor domain-containing protein n=1 Tax=Cinchona calisaya TaxID=153742 RepID=A0ABD2ZB44_9GENT